MKKLINDPADVVVEALRGIDAAHPELQVDHHNKIIYRGDAPRPGKVSGVYFVSIDGNVPDPAPCFHCENSTPPRRNSTFRVGRTSRVALPYGCLKP